jgi:DNA-binding NarL/FixJ family response regulator
MTQALEAILNGQIYVPSSLAQLPTVPAGAAPPVADDAAALPLTPRQRDVLELIVQGQSNKEIARTLGLGDGTVKIHLAALFRNLGVANRASAAAIGVRLLHNNER